MQLVRFFYLVEYLDELRYLLVRGSLYHELNYQRIQRNTAFGKRAELVGIYLAAVIADDRKKCIAQADILHQKAKAGNQFFIPGFLC